MSDSIETLELENKMLRARNERLLAEQHLQALHDENVRLGLYDPACSGCGKTNTQDSQWACYCVDCWTKAQPEQKLVGTVAELFDEGVIWMRELDRDLLVYIAPPQRTAAVGENSKAWVELTDEEVVSCWARPDMFAIAHAIQSKSKQKNISKAKLKESDI